MGNFLKPVATLFWPMRLSFGCSVTFLLKHGHPGLAAKKFCFIGPWLLMEESFKAVSIPSRSLPLMCPTDEMASSSEIS